MVRTEAVMADAFVEGASTSDTGAETYWAPLVLRGRPFPLEGCSGPVRSPDATSAVVPEE